MATNGQHKAGQEAAVGAGRLRRIAVLDHMSAGGVSRFLLALLTHMAALYPNTHITYFVSQVNIDRDGLREAFEAYPNVDIEPLDPPITDALERGQVRRNWLWRVSVSILKLVPALHRVLLSAWERLRDGVFAVLADRAAWWRYRLPAEVVGRFDEFEVVYIGWPYYCEPIKTSAPIVATFHDFHFKHFPNAYGNSQRELVERETAAWMKTCTTAVTSTKFIRDELLSFYGDLRPEVEVVYLAPYGFDRPSSEAIEATLGDLGVRHPYALFSGGRSGHKNFVAILEAVGILKSQGTPVHLAITGLGSDGIGKPSDAHSSDPVHQMNRLIRKYRLVRGVDYFPLGYVPNSEVDALTAGADVVVSASLYEAGCGPANDAWQAGAPVAFSNIPQFLEQLDRFGVKAWVFDPHDPSDVAEKIRSAVFDAEATTEMVETSRHAFDAYTWDNVAHEYYRVLAEAAHRSKNR